MVLLRSEDVVLQQVGIGAVGGRRRGRRDEALRASMRHDVIAMWTMENAMESQHEDGTHWCMGVAC